MQVIINVSQNEIARLIAVNAGHTPGTIGQVIAKRILNAIERPPSKCIHAGEMTRQRPTMTTNRTYTDKCSMCGGGG